MYNLEVSEKPPLSLRKPDKEPNASGEVVETKAATVSSTPVEKIQIPIENIRQINAELVQHATEQLNLIGPSLRDLAHRIETEKPDVLIFLDKSARPFGTPFKKHLDEKMGTEAPIVRFYNDAHLKQAYLDNDKDEIEQIAKEDFEELLNKKVFFIDETYSKGRGAAALESAQSILGPDIYYFALTIDPTTPAPPLHRGEFVLTEEQHQDAIDRIKGDPHFIYYPNPVHNLFSREISRLYVEERDDGSTYGIWGTDQEAQPIDRTLSIRDVIQAPEGVDQEKYEKEFRSSVFETIRTVKQKIYDTLENTR